MPTSPSKTRIGPVVLAVIASLAGLALFIAFLVQVSLRGHSNRWMYFLREGGFGSYVLILFAVVGAVVTAGLALWMTLRKTAWSWTLAVLPLLIVLAAALFEVLGVSRTVGAISGASVDPAQKFRIFAEGVSEASVLGILGALAACALLTSSSIVFAARALTRVPKGGFGAAAAGAMVGGVVGAGVLGGLALLLPSFAKAGLGFGLIPALAGWMSAVIAGMAMSDSTAPDKSRAEALGDWMISAACACCGVLMGVAATHGLGFRQLFGATSGESVDPSMAGRIAFEALGIMNGAVTAHLAYAAPVLLAALVAILMSSKVLAQAAKSAWAGLLTIMLVGLLSAAMLFVPRLNRERALADHYRAANPGSINLAVVSNLSSRPSGHRLLVGPDRVAYESMDLGATSSLDETSCLDISKRFSMQYDRKLFVVDAGLPFRPLSCLLVAFSSVTPDPTREYEFLTRLANDSHLPSPWDAFAVPTGSVRLRVRAKDSPNLKNHLHLARDTWLLRDGDKQTPLTGSTDERLRAVESALLSDLSLEVTVEPDVPASNLLAIAGSRLRWVLALELYKTQEQAMVWPPAREDSLLGGLGFGNSLAEPGSGTGPRIRTGPLAVTGRLPPEVIQRIVRQNFGRFRLCYESGLKKNPALEGKVLVRFVIGRDGSVPSATSAGSDLPNGPVVDCVTKSFMGLSFPQPEGGIVTVQYPLIFAPGK